MKATRKFIAITSIIVGVLLSLLGIASIGFYIYSVIDALGKADQSVIFWYLIFVFIGITLVGTGIYFIWIGYKSNKEQNYTGLAKYSLIILSTIIGVLLLFGALSEWSADKTRSERIKLEALQQSLAADMHYIERIKIDEFNQAGFSFSIHLSEGVEGSYRLKTSIDDGQTVFLEKAEEINLDSSETNVIRYVSFDQLFQKCFDTSLKSDNYICIENTGTKSFFKIESQLTLIIDKHQKINNTKHNLSFTSMGKTKFSLDTFTKDMKVTVNNFQPIDD